MTIHNSFGTTIESTPLHSTLTGWPDPDQQKVIKIMEMTRKGYLVLVVLLCLSYIQTP